MHSSLSGGQLKVSTEVEEKRAEELIQRQARGQGCNTSAAVLAKYYSPYCRFILTTGILSPSMQMQAHAHTHTDTQQCNDRLSAS